ncbi:MAG: 50S ribosome-binding GTPase [Planctomycetaceae bacterium]|nr:50S ribosome-binding GTPase [Planctomycetaceae bacterium]
MLTRRTIVLALLTTVPLLIYLGLGAYALWQTGLFAETFWILPGCWLFTWLISRMWRPPSTEQVIDQKSASHFTPRDQDAQAIIRRYQEQVDELSASELTDPHFYLTQSLALAQDLSRHYHPRAEDPINSLTVPEVLAAMRLAVDDIEGWMLHSVPGSHLVTIGQWKMLRHAPKWIERIQNAAWATGVLVNPANVVKYLTSRLTMGPISQELQAEFLAAVYLRFIRQVGFYLIEMNSGRLRGGADKYRQAFQPKSRSVVSGIPDADMSPSLMPESLTVALVGQVKAGKSSLVNALIGDQVAATDVLPETATVTRYHLDLPETRASLELLDTPGYADAGATPQQLQEVKQALRESAVAILVMDAHSPARSADRKVVDELKSWYASQPSLKPPPMIVCLTHIDLLSPMMEWDPPYNFRDPKSKKEHSIHEALAHVTELFGDCAKSVVAVCTDVERGREEFVETELLPALIRELSEGQSVALLKAYHRELGKHSVKKLLNQLKTGGKQLLQTWVEERWSESGLNQ